MDQLLKKYNQERIRTGAAPIPRWTGKKSDLAHRLITIMSLSLAPTNSTAERPPPPPPLPPSPQVKRTSSRGAITKWSDKAVITVLKHGAPKKMTKRNPYAHYRDGWTVGETLATGKVMRRDINWDESQGYIKLTEPEKEKGK